MATSTKRHEVVGKSETEKHAKSLDQDQKYCKNLRDHEPIESVTKHRSDTIPNTDTAEKESNWKQGEFYGSKRISNSAGMPRHQSYFQHDDRGTSGNDIRNRRERGRWTDLKDGTNKNIEDKDAPSESQNRVERTKNHGDEISAWRHDRYYELETEAPPRKRPAFSEKKRSPEPGNTKFSRPSEASHPTPEVREGRIGYPPRIDRRSDRRDDANLRNARLGDRPPHRAETQKTSFPSRDNNHRDNNISQDRFNGRYGGLPNRRNRVQIEKWKHDLFDEANRSPSPKNEEDQIARIEALLAS